MLREIPQRQESASQPRQLSLRDLGESYKACKGFATNCSSRVDSLEQYKKAADQVIAGQEKKIVDLKEEKKSFPWLHVTISVLVGALTGVILL